MFSIRALAKAGLLPMTATLMLLMSSSLPVHSQTLTGKTVNWALSRPQIVNPGQTTQTKEGELTVGYTVEFQARSSDAPMIRNGVLRVTLSSFSPSKDMVGQRKGSSHVSGTWELIEKNAAKTTLRVRHNDVTVKGLLKTDLPFNPIKNAGNLEAKAELPMTHLGDKWAKGNGLFQWNRQSKRGELTLTIERWQTVK